MSVCRNQTIRSQCTLSLHPENIENLTVLRCFQGVEKGCIANKWVKIELLWQVNNLRLRNGKSIVASKPQRRAVESFVKHIKQGTGSKLEAKDHMNILELKAEKFIIMVFTEVFFVILSLFQIFSLCHYNFL